MCKIKPLFYTFYNILLMEKQPSKYMSRDNRTTEQETLLKYFESIWTEITAQQSKRHYWLLSVNILSKYIDDETSSSLYFESTWTDYTLKVHEQRAAHKQGKRHYWLLSHKQGISYYASEGQPGGQHLGQQGGQHPHNNTTPSPNNSTPRPVKPVHQVCLNLKPAA